VLVLTDREVRALAIRRGLCLRCAEHPPHARGLCTGCYDTERHYGRLGCWRPARTHRRGDEVLDDWFLVAGAAPAGTTLDQLAARIGISRYALRNVLIRARATGDRRAIYHNDHARLSRGKGNTV
jgi:hypothetical protein